MDGVWYLTPGSVGKGECTWTGIPCVLPMKFTRFITSDGIGRAVQRVRVTLLPEARPMNLWLPLELPVGPRHMPLVVHAFMSFECSSCICTYSPNCSLACSLVSSSRPVMIYRGECCEEMPFCAGNAFSQKTAFWTKWMMMICGVYENSMECHALLVLSLMVRMYLSMVGM